LHIGPAPVGTGDLAPALRRPATAFHAPSLIDGHEGIVNGRLLAWRDAPTSDEGQLVAHPQVRVTRVVAAGQGVIVVLEDVEIVVDGKTVSRLTMTAALAQTTIPAVAERVSGEYLFIGSTVGESVLLKTARVDQEVDSGESASTPAAVVDMGQNMDLDDDDGKCFFSFHTALILTPFPVDIYGDSKVPVNAPANGVLNGKGPTKHKRAVVHLSLCDSLPAYGPIADITFSLAKNGVRGFTSSYSKKSKHGMNRIVRSLSLWLRLAQACLAASRCSR